MGMSYHLQYDTLIDSLIIMQGLEMQNYMQLANLEDRLMMKTGMRNQLTKLRPMKIGMRNQLTKTELRYMLMKTRIAI